jgi:glycosyltransferase involved in cell wall biosynthesis
MLPENNFNNTPAKRRIAWVTSDNFVDCDFNPGILSEILKDFDILWVILLPVKDARFEPGYFDKLKTLDGLTIEFLTSKVRKRDPRRLQYYYSLYRKIKRFKPDVTYINIVADPYFIPVSRLLNKNKTIMCAHDGEIKVNFHFIALIKAAFNLTHRHFRNTCMFSPSQAEIFQRNFPHAKIFITRMALKDFGASNVSRSSSPITFLSFGTINVAKAIELLIQAACNIYDKGYRGFNVSINGWCAHWDFYDSFIRYPEIFKHDVRIIDNDEIPDLFSAAHYFVQPYRQMSQSGAIKVAFNYNLPVIASDLQGFRDDIVVGTNGYLFKSEDIQDLEQRMIEALERNESDYNKLLESMKTYTSQNYSPVNIAREYIKMFNEVINEP